MSVVFSDLHLREQSADVCFRVLEHVRKRALETDKHVIFSGDFWHIRYQVPVRLQNRLKRELEMWDEHEIQFEIVPGNHDQVDIDGENALEIFDAYENIRVHTNPGYGYIGVAGSRSTLKAGFIPYRKDPGEVYAAITDLVTHNQPQIIFAHFPLQGSIMNNGSKDQHGFPFPPGLNVPLILGHYHKRQVGPTLQGSWPAWQYVGSPYQTNYGEVGNQCGILIIEENEGRYPKVTFEPLDVGAPKHYIVEWDPSKSDTPPPAPGEPGDNVWLKIKASREMIVSGKFKGVLKKHGLGDVCVSVEPVRVDREHRFAVDFII